MSSLVYVKSKEVSISALIELHDNANSNANTSSSTITLDMGSSYNKVVNSFIRLMKCKKVN